MQPLEDLAAVRPLLETMAATLWPTFKRAVTPVAAIRDERAIQMGTGTFFKVADESFVVTASHVWNHAEKLGFDHDLHVFDVGDPVEGGVSIRPVPLNGMLHRANDPTDVAVFALSEETAGLLSNVHFLRLDEVLLRPRTWSICWVFGFPVELTEDRPSQARFQFNHLNLAVPLYSGSADALLNYDPQFHFLLNAARDGIVQTDGTPAALPAYLNGISGCSIWQPEWPAGNSVENWNLSRTRIVGVQTGHYRGPSIIKATHWGAVANVLYQGRPELRRVIEMHLGRP